MQRYATPHLGLDIPAFWGNMERCFAELLASDLESRIEPKEELIPTIELSPPPEAWPDPADFLEEEEQQGGSS
jgi:hypothetical protein